MVLTTHYEYIKNTSTCGKILTKKLTGNWQKDFCTTKTVRKIHMESGGKGREAIRLRPVLLENDRVKGRLHGWRSTLGHELFQPHIRHHRLGV